MCVIQKVQAVAARIAADVVSGRLAPGDRVPSVRDLARLEHCSPGTAARAHRLLREAGVITGHPRALTVVSPEGPLCAVRFGVAEPAGTLRLSGSDDPALDLLLSAAGTSVVRATGARGSVAGLGLLAQGSVDAAAIHLRDARTGRYNDPFTRRLFGGEPAVLVHLWRRQQGIVVASENPRSFTGVADLGGARLAWRAPGTGSRLVLARLLHDAHVSADPEGQEPCESHLGVAVAVAAGAADAGLAVRWAAEAVAVDFLPLEWEDFELAVSPDNVGLLSGLLSVLASTTFSERVAGMAGYDLSRSGETRMAA